MQRTLACCKIGCAVYNLCGNADRCNAGRNGVSVPDSKLVLFLDSETELTKFGVK
jgi:hypothetical protein